MAFAANEIAPAHDAGLQHETPMRPASLRMEFQALVRVQRERGAVIDGRRAARDLQTALALQFLRRLITGIEPTRRLERFGGMGIEVEALRLAHLGVGRDAQPSKIDLNGLRVFFFRALKIGVVETQDEHAAMFAGEEIVQQRRARVADMNASGRRRGEADDGRA